MTTDIQEAERAVIEAAIEVYDCITRGEIGDVWSAVCNKHNLAVQKLCALRTPPAPLRCEPLGEFKGDQWHWVRQHPGFDPAPLPWTCANGGFWRLPPNPGELAFHAVSPEEAGEMGWVWIGVARPTPELVEPADEAIYKLWESMHEGDPPKTFGVIPGYTRAALRRFNAPAKTISDAEIVALWRSVLATNTTGYDRMDAPILFARAIIAKVQG